MHALLQYHAVDRRDQGQRPAQLARRDAGQGQALPAFAGLGAGLGSGGTGRLQAGFGNQPLGEQLLVALQVLLQQRRLATGLQGVALQFQRLRAGQVGDNLAALDGGTGRHGEHFDHAGDRCRNDAHLGIRHQHAGRVAAAARFATAGGDGLDAQCLDLGALQRQRFGVESAGGEQGGSQQEAGKRQSAHGKPRLASLPL